MCEIAGFCNFSTDFSCYQRQYVHILDTMADTLCLNSTDKKGTYLSRHIGLVHTHTPNFEQTIIAPPIYRSVGGFTYAISFKGALHNRKELKTSLFKRGWRLKTDSATEIILLSYIEYGQDFISKLQGNLVFAIADERLERLLLYRSLKDGASLYYNVHKNTFLFSSKLQTIFPHPELEAQNIDINLSEEYTELKPGQYLVISSSNLSTLIQKSEHS